MSIEPRGDGLDDLREALRHKRWHFTADEMMRVLSQLDENAARLHDVTRPEAVGYREISGRTFTVLRCRACNTDYTGPSSSEWLAAPPAPNE